MNLTIGIWCVLVAALMPYVVVGIAKAQRGYDNADPRNPDLYKTDLQRRAQAAHQNCFEAFPFFVAAVFFASLSLNEGAHRIVDAMAVGWVVLRVGYIACYLGGLASLRSIVWSLALLLNIAIFTAPAWLQHWG